MALPMPPNVTVNIYRTANPGAPYSLGAAGPQGVRGFLRPVLPSGRNGSANWLKWTHLLSLPPGTDIRDAYNSQLDPSRNNSLADVVVLASSVGAGARTAFYVVFVEVALRGSAFEHLRIYLDRFQPSTWPVDSL
jgi:hypothetical protein